MSAVMMIDGESLDVHRLSQIGGGGITIDLTVDTWQKVEHGRRVIDDILESGKVVYGINTGFGNFKNVVIDPAQVNELQLNLIRSHCAGTGNPLSRRHTRMIAALRVNVLAKGHSGVRPETLKRVIDMFNHDCLPVIPEKGTVGASGDLAPQAHLTLGFMGEGQMWDPATGQIAPAKDVLARHGLPPIELRAKEGLALINGTGFITALASDALVRALDLVKQSIVISALSLEALQGSVQAFNARIHAARPHPGQRQIAALMRALLHRQGNQSAISRNHKNCGRVQDSYTLRCIPQVVGVVYDTLRFVENILNTELNSATDNPMVFTGDEASEEHAFKLDDVSGDRQQSFTISGGNFHGEYPAKACDYLCIAISEIANISERRIERLVNPTLSHGLPAFLVKEGGLHSGFMIPHVTAAALVSENKALCFPSSVDSISTSAGQEDHVSMGGWAARKVLQVVDNVEMVLAIELMSACQGIDFLRPLTSTPPLEAIHHAVRTKVAHWGKDRVPAEDMQRLAEMLRRNEIWKIVSPLINPRAAL
eukprot:c47750_g1_i1.p1 GENE.c47750_g1_i1~~c47750_g1_i1.p1  ORF type:complete len:539 (-),score=103.19 c47750_g1_i1:134-1750(-)